MIGILLIWGVCLISYLSWCELNRRCLRYTIYSYYDVKDVLLLPTLAPVFYIAGLYIIHRESV